jgi:uncharacterized protein YkwD
MAILEHKRRVLKKTLLSVAWTSIALAGLAALLGYKSPQPASAIYWGFFAALIIAASGTLVMIALWFGSINKYPKAHWRRVVIVFFELLGLSFCLLIGAVVYAGSSSNYYQEQAKAQQEKELQEKNIKRSAISTAGLFLAINKMRIANATPALESNELLNKSAQMQCDDMSTSNYYANKNPNTGKNGWGYIKDAGTSNYDYALAGSYAGLHYSAEEVIDAWALNESSKASMLDPKYDQVGFAKCQIAQLGSQDAYVMHLVKKYTAPPTIIYQQPAPVYRPPVYEPPSTYRCSEDYVGTGITCRSSAF